MSIQFSGYSARSSGCASRPQLSKDKLTEAAYSLSLYKNLCRLKQLRNLAPEDQSSQSE